MKLWKKYQFNKLNKEKKIAIKRIGIKFHRKPTKDEVVKKQSKKWSKTK